jgi:hypothetical protein
MEAASEQSACEAGKQAVRTNADADALATIALQMETSGGLSAIFSELEIEGDLENIRLNLGFSAALDLQGKIRFAPSQALGPLTECLNAWQSTFTGKVVLPQLISSMIGVIRSEPSALVTDWSGYVISASISPTPLESMFMNKPRLLADCQIGLTVDRLSEKIDGGAQGHLTGYYQFEIQPTQSRIDLAPASVEYGQQLLQAAPELSGTHLKYDIRD